MAKVLVSDPLTKQGIAILEEAKGIEVESKPGLSEDELVSIIGGYDALLVRSGTQVTAKIIEAGKNLKVIGRAGVGLDNVDLEAATRAGIVVMNTPDGNTISTAEHTMSLILALSRNIPQANASLKGKEWKRSEFAGVEVFGKTLGIIGLGRIGREVAKRASGFGMKIIAYDPFVSIEHARGMKIEMVELDDLYKLSDFITFHIPLTEESRHMVGAKELAMMKDGVRIINCARGGIIDEGALYAGLTSGKVAGCALDVYEQEPPFDSPLLELNNCITVPHLGASTKEAQLNVAIDIARQVVDCLTGGPIRNAANIPVMDPELAAQLQPFITLSERLGKLSAQLVDGNMEEITVEYAGQIASKDINILTTTIIKGLLMDQMANYVNAISIATEQGIKITESKTSQREDFVNLISVSVKTDRMSRMVAGTIFKRSDPHLVYIDHFEVDAVPEGDLLILFQTDEPGIIGRVGTILGENGINIGWLKLGREKVGGQALSLWNLDGSISEKTMAEITSAPEIKEARLVRL